MDLGEADRILTLYTRDHGKLRAVAKGVRRTSSRSAGHLELFTRVDVLLARGRELDVVSQADTVTAFRRVREDLVLSSHAYYLSELTDHLTEDRMENRAVFSILTEALAALDRGVEPRLVLVTFLLLLLSALGYRPELLQCVTCRADIQPGPNHFSGHLGGVLCPACGAREVSAHPIASDALKLLRYLQRTRGQQIVAVPDLITREAEGQMRGYAEGIMERRLRSPELIAHLSGTPELAAADL